MAAEDVQTKDWVTWGLMIAALYLLAKGDCGCGEVCEASNPMATNLTAPDFIQQLGSGVNVS